MQRPKSRGSESLGEKGLRVTADSWVNMHCSGAAGRVARRAADDFEGYRARYRNLYEELVRAQVEESVLKNLKAEIRVGSEMSEGSESADVANLC